MSNQRSYRSFTPWQRSVAEHYDQQYAGSVVGTFQMPDLEPLLEQLEPGSQVLDLGCGLHSSLTLARAGHRVTAYDLSRVAVVQLERAACREGLALSLELRDVTQPFEGIYNAVLMLRLLHDMPRAQAIDLLVRAQEQTAPGGYHLVVAYGEKGSLKSIQQSNGDQAGLYPRSVRTLEQLYPGWQLVWQTTQQTGLMGQTQQSNQIIKALFRRCI